MRSIGSGASSYHTAIVEDHYFREVWDNIPCQLSRPLQGTDRQYRGIVNLLGED